MGKRGKHPTPTKLKIVQGTRESRINRNEPQPPVARRTPQAPKWMDVDAQEVWREVGPLLFHRGLLTDFDLEPFAAYCEAVVQHRRACRLVDQSGLLIKSSVSGALIQNPANAVVRNSAERVLRFAMQFGLTPSSRSGITMPEGEDYDDARRLLS